MLFQKSKLWDFRLVSTSDFWWVFWLLQSLLLRRCRPVRKWSDRFHTSVQRGLKGTTTHSKDRKREARTYMAKNVLRKFQGAVEECAKKTWLRSVQETFEKCSRNWTSAISQMRSNVRMFEKWSNVQEISTAVQDVFKGVHGVSWSFGVSSVTVVFSFRSRRNAVRSPQASVGKHKA